ncbi:hypothetical protein CBS63078_10770 [Aspergillus niger]|nr:hypothetical protein CBS13152_10982 [Aspergillus niger]KAI2872050.1 hypothetical protein CBS11852_10893 [Aspergillus niger]KAI2887115.1 hypothetical protein CBS63078_10770 [Aspergillus niger]KAI3034820.1 hypothetical protein CBS76997_11035 [Aspergillus niger]KAI3054864.1 hypothetical protein CBS147353_11394 [Aspergillus niger]
MELLQFILFLKNLSLFPKRLHPSLGLPPRNLSLFPKRLLPNLGLPPRNLSLFPERLLPNLGLPPRNLSLFPERLLPNLSLPLRNLRLFLKDLSPFPQSPLLKKHSSSGPFPKCLLIPKAGLLLLYLLAILPITKYYPRLLIKHKPKVI